MGGWYPPRGRVGATGRRAAFARRLDGCRSHAYRSRIEFLLEHALPGNPLVVYVVLPVVAVPVLLAIAYRRLRSGQRISKRAARWAVVAAGLAFVMWTLMAIQGIVMSESSTAFLAIIVIGPFGLLFAAIAFILVWGMSVVGQWVLAPSRRRPGDLWPLAVAWVIVVLSGGTCTTIGYSMYLQRLALSDASPSRLMTCHIDGGRLATRPCGRHWRAIPNAG
jgi:hypothetical protein